MRRENMIIECSKHPHYSAWRQPKVDCVDCWKMWAHRLQERVRGLELLKHRLHELLDRTEKET
jgi:hypothetical protein